MCVCVCDVSNKWHEFDSVADESNLINSKTFARWIRKKKSINSKKWKRCSWTRYFRIVILLARARGKDSNLLPSKRLLAAQKNCSLHAHATLVRNNVSKISLNISRYQKNFYLEIRNNFKIPLSNSAYIAICSTKTLSLVVMHEGFLYLRKFDELHIFFV